MEQPTLEQVRERFCQDRFATVSGALIEEISDGYAKCVMRIRPDHLNAAGTVMGGAVFTLADFAFAVAANWNRPLSVSLNSQITFLSPAKGDMLIAQARLVKDGRSTCYYLVDVKDSLDRPVAHVTVNGFVKR